MPVIYPFGHKILCDGYVLGGILPHGNSLTINQYLCDGYVITPKKTGYERS